MQVRQATIEDLAALAVLFNGYRQFYQQPGDIDKAKDFLVARIQAKESVIFVAEDAQNEAVGFTQLYPTFSSVSVEKRWVLNDLFVAEQARKLGVADLLMQKAELFAKESGAGGLSLSTAIDNVKAQALYEKRGWQKDTAFHHYNMKIK